MRITSITVRNYRLHRELTVELDPARTLIGGPNECGKSTLVQAAHRALFLRAKTTAEAQKQMISRLLAGHPEVEICFEARGRAWRLLKRFSGANGTTTLTEVNGQSWPGDEAETRLGELLGVEAKAAGKGAATHAERQWAHLWIWQGCAGEDPTEHATAQSSALLARLAGEGGAAAMQSECDARVARVFAQRHETFFTKAGEPKAGTALATAIAEEQAAAAAHDAAKETLARLEQAVRDFGDAAKVIAASDELLARLRRDSETVESQLARVAALRSDEHAQALSATAAAEKHDALVEADAQIRKLHAESAKLAAALAPRESETQRLADEEKECRKREFEADETARNASASARAARLRSDLAAAHVQRIEKAAQRDQLGRRLEQVRASRERLAKLESALAQTRPVTPAKLKALQALDGDCAKASAALDAMAAGIEVVSSNAPVRVGPRELGVGEVHVLTEDAEISIGPKIRLRIRPGGGTSLAEARETLRRASEKLRQELDDFGFKTVGEAAEMVARRQDLESDIKAERLSLGKLGADAIDEEFAAAANASAAAEADVQRRAALVAEPIAPATLDEAEALVRRCTRELDESESGETSARAAREVASKMLRQAGERLAAHREGLEKQRRTVADIEAQLRLLLEKHGDDAARAKLLAELRTSRSAAEQQLAGTRDSLAKLQPDLLESDRTRLGRAIDQHTAAKIDAEQKRAVARNALQRDGSTDPHAELELAGARLRAAVERRASAARKADAIRLLHELFEAEQKALAAQFTAPLADKISGYLECLFGPGARADVTLESNAFSGLRLTRPGHGGAFDFENLSGGTCEQLAAAVRLAMAEVLAPAHDGCLPVVFDDAFAYSDPDRVQVLQRMLDRAASRGLQIIVLTCNPADYAALGAKQITLQPERAMVAPNDSAVN